MLTLPKSFGGQTHELCIAGSYTFRAAADEEELLPSSR